MIGDGPGAGAAAGGTGPAGASPAGGGIAVGDAMPGRDGATAACVAAGGGVAGPARWRVARAEAARWDLPLLAGVLPLLVSGFFASAAANRLAFAAWGLAAALGWFGALRLGLVRGWSRGGRAGTLLVVAAAALAVLAPLLARHGAALDSGLRTVAPALAPAAPGPVAALVLSLACALAGGGVLATDRGAARRPPHPRQGAAR